MITSVIGQRAHLSTILVMKSTSPIGNVASQKISQADSSATTGKEAIGPMMLKKLSAVSKPNLTRGHLSLQFRLMVLTFHSAVVPFSITKLSLQLLIVAMVRTP